MIKTALIIERADIALGGAERSIFELKSQLSTLGIKVTILAAKGHSSLDDIKVLCNRPGRRRCGLAEFQTAIRKHLAQNDYDIIHSTLPFDFADVYQPRGGSYPETIVRNAASYQNKLVSSYKLLTHRANLRRAALLHAERQLCSNEHRTIVAALSQYVQRQFEQHYGLDHERIVVIPNGVKLPKQASRTHADKLRTQILTRLAITESSEPTMFLFAANNFRLKGLWNLIKAMQLLSRRQTARRAYLVVAGSASSAKYRRLARKSGVGEKIVFLGQLRNIQDALSICDIAISPTYYDPCSRYILEALAGAKPVITTRFNGASEMFVNNRHGITIDSPDEIGQLADAINHYCDRTNVRKATDAIIADNLGDSISIARHAERVVKLYKSILQTKGVKW